MTNDPTTSEVIQEIHYYPFGLPLPGHYFQEGTSTANHYRYNGKELLEDVGLYDYGARYYDPAIGRWNAVDPLASDYAAWSPYNYVMGNPISFTDPDGRSVEGDYYGSDGSFLGSDGIDDGKIYLANEGQTVATLGLNTGLPFANEIFSQIRAENSVEVGGLITLERTGEGTDYTESSVELIGSEGVEETMSALEPGGPETTVANQDQRIPDGTYNVSSYSSASYPDNFIISNENVNHDRRILIHAGNTGRNTAGCILPGCGSGTGRVNNSRTAMGIVRDFIDGKDRSSVSNSARL